jgi:hypothetical protein
MKELIYAIYFIVCFSFASYFYNTAMESDSNPLGKITAFLWGALGWAIGAITVFFVGMSITIIFKL